MDYLPENIGTHLAIDEVALSQENCTPLSPTKG
jgi:hypothetical protein